MNKPIVNVIVRSADVAVELTATHQHETCDPGSDQCQGSVQYESEDQQRENVT